MFRVKIRFVALFLLVLATAVLAAWPALADVPRFLFAAQKAPHLRADDNRRVEIRDPLDARALTLTDANPIDDDFYTIDTRLLAKAPVEDLEHPGTYRIDREIPAVAIMGHSVLGKQWAHDEPYTGWVTRFNGTYVDHFAEGKYPRARLPANEPIGWFSRPEHEGVTGPKLILTADGMLNNAVETPSDELTVVLHGQAGGAGTRENTPVFSTLDGAQRQRRMTAHELAGEIRNAIAAHRLRPTVRVRLIACKTGENAPGENGSAQALADALVTADNPAGNEVIAPTGLANNNVFLIRHQDRPSEVIVHPIIVSPHEPTERAQRMGHHPDRVPPWRIYTGRNAQRGAALARARPPQMHAH
jgi:hypothetical protein